MSKIHVVSQGECLSRIAKRYGFKDYRTIYEHAENAGLRQKRPNPNVLHPGDRISIPDMRRKEEVCSTGRLHRFVIKEPQRILRIALEDVDGKRLEGCAYTLKVGAKSYTGTVPAGGLLEKPIPADDETGSLKVKIGNREYEWTLGVATLNPMAETPDRGVTGTQARLKNLGFDPGPIDGILGPKTTNAIRAFQAKNPPLAVDGICGPKTWANLVERHGC